jgi:DNA (cytosine-5)-methyltransferase 1
MNIFDLMYPPIKLKPPIRLFEAFSGIGTQAMALKRITNDYEIVGYSEIDKYAIQSYHAIHGGVKAYGDITKMGEIPPCDIFTWSFPCTDLSKAGKRQGMNKETRSGLVYEVLRLVRDTHEKPKVLIMENVPDLIQEKFHRQFRDIQVELESYGYTNYIELLNAKNYGIAQNRNRVFMVSVLGEYSYSFPKWIPLKKRLKDYLEHEVDEKYYLSEKQLGQISNWKSYQNPLDNILHDDSNSPTITTRVAETDAGGISASMIVYGDYSKTAKMNYMPGCRDYKENGWSDIAQTLLARDYKDPKVVAIPEATKKGYALAKDGDGVYLNRPHQKRGVVQDQTIQTIKANGNDIGVVDNLRIRKLTPLECWRLMGIDDEDFYKAKNDGVSNSQLYKQAGNAIVVDVFEAILRQMIEV